MSLFTPVQGIIGGSLIGKYSIEREFECFESLLIHFLPFQVALREFYWSSMVISWV
jgi:hypothetical protein